MTATLLSAPVAVEGLRTRLVMARPGQMYGWPGLCRAANGDLLVAASERRYHCCPFGREVVARSTDDGRTWSLPEEIHNSELDDRDANLAVLPDGTVALSWFTSMAFGENPRWRERAARVSPLLREKLIGSWLLLSRDHGRTWEDEPRRMPGGNHISPAALADGTLLTFAEDGHGILRVHRSRDQGQSWRPWGVIPGPTDERGRTQLNEGHLLEVAPGRLVGVFRVKPDGGYIHQTDSADGGRTWTHARRLPVWGYPPQLTLLKNGVLMCGFGHRRRPYSIRAMFSRDLGATWDTEQIVTLHTWDDEPDMGYPSTIELNDGGLLTVFYCSRRDAHPESTLPEGILSATYRLRFGAGLGRIRHTP